MSYLSRLEATGELLLLDAHFVLGFPLGTIVALRLEFDLERFDELGAVQVLHGLPRILRADTEERQE
jgi:hypothetical protein